MKTYLADIIPKIKQFSQKLDNLTLLTNQHWVVVDELRESKCVYIFRSNNELLISQNGRVEKGKWEYLGNNSLLIDKIGESFLFRHGFFDEKILALKIDGKNEYAILVNENKIGREVNSIDTVLTLLTTKYLSQIDIDNYPELQNDEIDYKIIEECSRFYPLLGKRFYFKIQFPNGQVGTFHKRNKNGKYYFIIDRDVRAYFNTKDEAVKGYYDHLKKRGKI